MMTQTPAEPRKKKEEKESKETPLMKQFNAIKAKHPGTILLFRVGDFYETFGEDAVEVSRILGIVLTSRNNGGSDLELAGFPYHSLDNYLPKLVRAGQRVAVVDQLEDPKQAKGIVKRGVTELVTPGVALNDKILDASQSNYLAAVGYTSPKELGVAFVEVSTGDFFCFSGSVNNVEKVISTLRPAEILVPRKDMRAFKMEVGDKYYVTRVEDWVFQFDYAHENLIRHFGTNSLKGFGIDDDIAGTISAGAILHYLKDTQQSDLAHIGSIYRFNDSEFVWMDQFTVRNLELLQPNHPDGKALIDVLDDTQTSMGARLMRRWLLFPLKDLNGARHRLDVVESFLKDPQRLDQLCDLLRKLGDLERLVSKLATYKLAPREAMQFRASLRLMEPILETLQGFGGSEILRRIKGFEDLSGALEILEHYLAEDPSNNLNTGGVIRSGVSERLDDLRDVSANSKDRLLAMQHREIERTGISKLKIGFNKVFGYYIEISHANSEKVPDDFIRKQTLTNAERYITPELKEYEEKILGAEDQIVILETDLYNEALGKLQAFLKAIQKNASLIAGIDVLVSFARVARARKYTKPRLENSDKLDIRSGRHPVIEITLPKDTPYIPNDVYLDNESQQIMIITGPNMAGKSALLRQTALIALMAQVGSFVPADEVTLGLVDKIFVRVGASDNISGGESTFMVEMNETARIINNASRKSLILLDEIGRGTSTYDGVSIAWSLVEYLHETKVSAAKTLFATHYHELNEITNRFGRVKNYNVSVKEIDGKVLFMRKLLPGGSNHSFGIHVAEMAGMPRKVVDRSKELLVHFESAKVEQQEAAKSVKFSSRQQIQLNMFELKDADTLKIREILAGCDIDRMTPVEALLKLQEIKKALVE
ncbi:MAG: DNA mismatch repair protein MutS [Bacteroidia bacterium]|nr:DNA mismatch repair protein MutS [Bacteroidia bacterium]